MRFAVTVPNVGMLADAALLSEMAARAEAAGWDGWFVWDHLLYHHEDWPVVDPWVALSAAVARTKQIRLGVMVAALPRYRPWRLAKTAVTLDRMSGGRLQFAVGLGSIPAEYSRFGEPDTARARADRLDEALAIVDQAWRGEPVVHHGEHFIVDAPAMLPTPVQQPRIPVWVAGRWPARRPFRRAARWDGVFLTHADFPHGTTVSPGAVAEIVDYVSSHRGADASFDVVMEGESPAARDHAARIVAPYAALGVTWWLEKLGWWRGTIDQVIDRIDAGPPTSADRY